MKESSIGMPKIQKVVADVSSWLQAGFLSGEGSYLMCCLNLLGIKLTLKS